MIRYLNKKYKAKALARETGRRLFVGGMKMNQGDTGFMIICPVEDAIRIRTGEHGEDAIHASGIKE